MICHYVVQGRRRRVGIVPCGPGVEVVSQDTLGVAEADCNRKEVE